MLFVSSKTRQFPRRDARACGGAGRRRRRTRRCGGALASRGAPSQIIELRKEVLDVRFVGYGGESGAANDATPPSEMMTTTSDA